MRLSRGEYVKGNELLSSCKQEYSRSGVCKLRRRCQIETASLDEVASIHRDRRRGIWGHENRQLEAPAIEIGSWRSTDRQSILCVVDQYWPDVIPYLPAERSRLAYVAAPNSVVAASTDQHRIEDPVICLQFAYTMRRRRTLSPLSQWVLGDKEIMSATEDIRSRGSYHPIVRPEFKAKCAGTILMSAPARLFLRLDPGRQLGELIRIDKAYRITLSMGQDRTQYHQSSPMDAPAVEFEPVLLCGKRLDHLALRTQSQGIDQPPELQANPRGFLGAAIVFGKV